MDAEQEVEYLKAFLLQILVMYENTELRRTVKAALSGNYQEAIYDLKSFEEALNHKYLD